MQPLPGPFAKLAGVEVDEYDCIPKDLFSLEAAGCSIKAARIREHVLPGPGTQTVGVNRGGYMDGWPLLTFRARGKGGVWYLGTLPDAEGWKALLRTIILPRAGVAFREDIPAGVELVRRSGHGRTLTFALNHTPTAQTISWKNVSLDLASGRKSNGTVALEPYGVAILKDP
jgi:beta-galactosidase